MSEKFLVVFNPSAGAAFTATMPVTSGLIDGEAHRFKYIGPFAAQYPITLVPASGQTFDNGGVASVPLVGSNADVECVWSAALSSWLVNW